MPAVVALPAPLPNVIVNKPVLGLIEPENEFVGLPGNFTSALLLLTATLKDSGDSRLPPEMSSCPDGKSIGAVCGVDYLGKPLESGAGIVISCESNDDAPSAKTSDQEPVHSPRSFG